MGAGDVTAVEVDALTDLAQAQAERLARANDAEPLDRIGFVVRSLDAERRGSGSTPISS